jgi:hypothetical protein
VAQVDGQSAPQMAELELRGKAEGTASLEIVGKLNPLAKPLALDIEGRVRDLELPPLSPYTIKYTGTASSAASSAWMWATPCCPTAN